MSTVIKTTETTELAGTFFKKAHKLVFSQLSLSPVEHDIFALFLSRLKKKDWDDYIDRKTLESPHYTFSNQVLSEWFGVNKASLFNVLKKPSTKLAHQVIGVMNETEQRFRFLPLFKNVEYVNGSLTLVPNDLLINEFLCVSQGHSQIPHLTFRNLKRDYSKRLYSMLCRFKDPSKTELHYLSLEDLYANFGLLDQSGKLVKKTYGEFAYLMNRIIKPAIEEISHQESDIEFLIDAKTGNYGYSYRKKGRKVVAIKFIYKWRFESHETSPLNQLNSAEAQAEAMYHSILKSTFDELSALELTASDIAHLTEHIPSLMQRGCVLDTDFFRKLSMIQQALK